MRADHDSEFTSVWWTNRAKEVETNVQESAVAAQTSLGSGEKYHAPLRRIFLKIREEHPKIDYNIILKLAVKATTDTIRTEGLVPSCIVFGCIQRFPSTDYTLPTQQ